MKELHPMLRGEPTKIVPKKDGYSMPHDYEKMGQVKLDLDEDRDYGDRGNPHMEDTDNDGD